jgi:hypothetical protein
MRVSVSRTIYEKSLSPTHYIFLTNILQTVESGSKEPEHNMGSTVRWGDKVRNFPEY